MSDLINRQDAIERIESEYKKWGEEYDAIQVLGDLEDLPSAQPERCEDCVNFSKTRLLIPQPEIIRCKDCVHVNYTFFSTCYCKHMISFNTPNGFCSHAERRTDD